MLIISEEVTISKLILNYKLKSKSKNKYRINKKINKKMIL